MIIDNKYDYVGRFYPYYFDDGYQLTRYGRLEEILFNVKDYSVIDPISVIEALSKNYMFGDRTLVKGVYRSPWMAEPNGRSWQYFDLPSHGFRKIDPRAIADELFRRLREEIHFYVKGKRNLGVLLSGGMDSRIVAGILWDLIDKGDMKVDSVTSFTWGEYESRDVVYAKKIADCFRWRWNHYRVDAEELWKNIRIAGERGCEYTGFHLHGMPRVAMEARVDVLLAGSFGDSVGRGEYSGKHIFDLKPIGRGVNFRSTGYLVRDDVFGENLGLWRKDLFKYHQLYTRDHLYQQHELDYQLHYMRRMLNPCLEIINEVIPVRQVFTHPTVFGFMWSIHPKNRNDLVYCHLLDKLPSILKQTPWARTGSIFGPDLVERDNYLKSHHKYSHFMQRDLIDRVEDRLLNHHGLKEGIFNMYAIERLIRLIRRKQEYNFDFLEKLSWLVSYTYFFDKYKVMTESPKGHSIRDYLNGTLKLPTYYSFLSRARSLKDWLV
jgi:hypothetical protein